MRLTSRLLAALLCLCLSVTAFPATIFAESVQDDLTYILTDAQDGVIITDYSGNATELVIPETILGLPVVEIGYKAIGPNNTIQTVSLPDTLKTINTSAFEGCTALTAVSIPASVESIGNHAFYNCYTMSRVEMTSYTYDIGYHAFHNTKWLIDSPTGPVYLGRVLYTYFGRTTATTLTVRDYTAAIAPDALSGRNNFKEIYLPVGLRVIGDGAFSNCVSLTDLRIPPSVTSIGSGILTNSGLATVHCAKNSTIHEYAVSSEIPVEYDDTLDYLDGDTNQSGIVDSTDLRVLMRAIIGVENCDHERFLSCDIVYDGSVDTADVREWLMLSIL